MASLWLAILITVVASTANSVGKALQKEATKNLPKFTLEEKILRQYIQDRIWLIGLASDLAGGIIQIAAFALAPVSIVQPVSGVGLVGLAVYSHFFKKERLAEWEWAAVALAGLGTLGLGASSSAAATPTQPSALRMLAVLTLVGAAVASLRKLRQRHRHNKRRSGGDKTLAALYGLQAGGCFGLSAASCRTGFLMAAQRWTWVPFGLAGSVALSGTGFVLQTCGLKEGATVVVCTCVAVTAMVTGVVVGILGLGESMPGSFIATTIRVCSWSMILIGVVGLASGPGGMQELLAMVLQRTPAWVWQRLPVNVAVKAKSWAATRGGLPEISVHGGNAAAGGEGAGGHGLEAGMMAHSPMAGGATALSPRRP